MGVSAYVLVIVSSRLLFSCIDWATECELIKLELWPILRVWYFLSWSSNLHLNSNFQIITCWSHYFPSQWPETGEGSPNLKDLQLGSNSSQVYLTIFLVEPLHRVPLHLGQAQVCQLHRGQAEQLWVHHHHQSGSFIGHWVSELFPEGQYLIVSKLSVLTLSEQ